MALFSVTPTFYNTSVMDCLGRLINYLILDLTRFNYIEHVRKTISFFDKTIYKTYYKSNVGQLEGPVRLASNSTNLVSDDFCIISRLAEVMKTRQNTLFFQTSIHISASTQPISLISAPNHYMWNKKKPFRKRLGITGVVLKLSLYTGTQTDMFFCIFGFSEHSPEEHVARLYRKGYLVAKSKLQGSQRSYRNHN